LVLWVVTITESDPIAQLPELDGVRLSPTAALLVIVIEHEEY